MSVATRTAADTAPSFEELLLLVGQLNYSWTNTESLLIHMIAGLASVDKEAAIVIFLTLNTTRARMDLVERLAKLDRTPERCRDEVLEATRELSKTAKIRNKYNHCIYSFDKSGRSEKALLMRIFDGKKEIRFGKSEKIDSRELSKIRNSISDIEAVNRKIWGIILKYDFPA